MVNQGGQIYVQLVVIETSLSVYSLFCRKCSSTAELQFELVETLYGCLGLLLFNVPLFYLFIFVFI